MPTVSLPATTFTPEEKNEVFMKRLRTNTVKELEKALNVTENENQKKILRDIIKEKEFEEEAKAHGFNYNGGKKSRRNIKKRKTLRKKSTRRKTRRYKYYFF